MIVNGQNTLGAPVSVSGIGLFSGSPVTLRLCPAPAFHGIVFQRVDLPHKPKIPARVNFVQETPRCTVIGEQGVRVQTVEHLLAALAACQIDNALIELSGPEVPILDGSALPFVNMIEHAGACKQSEKRVVYKLKEPLYFSQGNVHLIALPSEEYRISYTMHYPNSTLLGSQFYSIVIHPESFKEQIAKARTFCIYEEIAPMIEKGLIKGGGLENAIIIKEDRVVNPEGVRFANEMVRHKVLDLIGDFSLVQYPFLAHIISLCSGHTSNTAFAKLLQNKMEHV